jgi:hypothetical protein
MIRLKLMTSPIADVSRSFRQTPAEYIRILLDPHRKCDRAINGHRAPAFSLASGTIGLL